ncbi:MAG: NADH-quinone oxidoreductase subunit L [Deltaproteobacteria bacterium]|nr:NADH-quinone oxidoreductase subunit L [Deltaproteobacteria bacterium]
MNALEGWSSLVPVIALAIPAALVLAAAVSPRRAELASATTLGLALLFALGAGLTPGGPVALGTALGVRVDVVTCVMLLLVCALGAIIARFSRTYLDGDPGLERYQRWLLLTLGAVTSLVIANNLLVIALGWSATSLALHQLLTFYADREAALVAAHKKFLVSRLADLCLLGCVALVYRDVESLGLDRIAAWSIAHPSLTPSTQAAAVLLVVAVALKSAQLPFHGWLTQVMEAPTPVSALLHAGIVNIGGFVLIRLSPWMAQAKLAQLLLVVIGLVSTVVAALVMTTRVSVKVALAWSTCAQMGFMLVQCGLGLWHLALLHLVAHSLYKAHAFLRAGTAVEDWRLRALSQPPPASSWVRVGAWGLVAGANVVICSVVLQRLGTVSQADARAALVLATLVGMSMVPWLARARGAAATVQIAARGVGVVLLYVGWHAAAARLMPAHHESSNGLSWVLVIIGFSLLFALKTSFQVSPEGRLARALYPYLYAGLYLDERFTRVTFRVWPPRLAKHEAPRRAIPLQDTLEVSA